MTEQQVTARAEQPVSRAERARERERQRRREKAAAARAATAASRAPSPVLTPPVSTVAPSVTRADAFSDIPEFARPVGASSAATAASRAPSPVLTPPVSTVAPSVTRADAFSDIPEFARPVGASSGASAASIVCLPSIHAIFIPKTAVNAYRQRGYHFPKQGSRLITGVYQTMTIDGSLEEFLGNGTDVICCIPVTAYTALLRREAEERDAHLKAYGVTGASQGTQALEIEG